MIYYVYDPATKHVKIGKTNSDIRTRLSTINTGTSTHLFLLSVQDETSELSERHIHDKFNALRLNGEWFKLNDELLEWITENDDMSFILDEEWIGRNRCNLFTFIRYLKSRLQKSPLGIRESLDLFNSMVH